MLGGLDTLWGIIVPGIFSAYGTFFLRQFFLTIPKELEEAATIDGCNKFQILMNIIIPNSMPAISSLTIFTFLGAWNSFMWPLIVIQSKIKELAPIPLGLASMIGQGQAPTSWEILMAGSMLATIPVLIIYIIFQKYITKGIVLSGLKG